MPRHQPAKHTYNFPRPALTVDLVVATWDTRPRVLLIKRKSDPYAETWALPGGFVEENETLADAARRELLEETGVSVPHMEQLYTVGDPGRDPRGWTVSVVYLARVNQEDVKAVAADDAADVKWFLLSKLPKLAFDHALILERAQARIVDRGV